MTQKQSASDKTRKRELRSLARSFALPRLTFPSPDADDAGDDDGLFAGNNDFDSPDFDDDFDAHMAAAPSGAENYDGNLENAHFDTEPTDKAHLDAIVDAVAKAEEHAELGDMDTSRCR